MLPNAENLEQITVLNQYFQYLCYVLKPKPRMKKIYLIVLALLTTLPVYSGPKKTIFSKEHFNVSVHGRYQHMLNEMDIYDEVLNSYGSALVGIQVGYGTHPSDSSWWSNAFNYPSLSLGFSYDNTGNLKTYPLAHMGDFYNLYLALEFDFLRAGIFSIGPVLELGMSFTTDKYSPQRNLSNRYIGSNVLANLAGGLEASFRFLPQWELALTGYLIHHSNGMVQVPNWGVNQAAAGAKLKYYLAPQETPRRIALEKPDYPKGLRWNVYTAFGGHSCDWELIAKGPEAYPVKRRFRAIVGAEAAWRYCRTLSTGIGIEGNYADNVYKEMDLLLRGQEDSQGYSPFYTSVHLIQNIHYSDFSVNIAVGWYTFKKTGLVEDMGKCFQRVGVRYHLPQMKAGQAFLSFGMRAHYFDRSYCLEYGAGFTF